MTEHPQLRFGRAALALGAGAQIALLALLKQRVEPLVVIVLVVFGSVVCLALREPLERKGYHAAWSLLGLLGVVGVIAAVALPRRPDTRRGFAIEPSPAPAREPGE